MAGFSFTASSVAKMVGTSTPLRAGRGVVVTVISVPFGAAAPPGAVPLDAEVGNTSFRSPSAGQREWKVRGRSRPKDRPMTITTPAVGAVARRTRLVSARDIELFTEISGDRNPIHYDEEVAAASRFGGLVVQGGVTSGLLNAVVAEDLPGPGSVFLEVAWKFLAPVRPGDEITAEVTVTDARADKPVTTLATRITNQDGVVVLDGTAVVWRDPVVAARGA